MPPSIYTKHNEKHRNGKGVFLVVSLLTAGLCSLYPVACFKNYSSKEKQKLKSQISNLEHKVEEEEEGRIASAQESPIFVEKRASSRESSRESSTVLAGGLSRSESSSATIQAAAIQRQESGPGASTPSPWPRTAPAISPQLVGGSTGSDASILTPGPDSLAEYRSKMRLMIASTPLPMGPTPPQSLTLPTTPGSQRSHHSFSTISSITSQESHASSFAYGLRRSKPDLRLLRKGSKPSQHLIPKSSIVKAALRDPRSTSFYTPKVVEDTGLLESTTKSVTPHTPPAKPLPLTLPELLRSEPPMKPLSKVQTFRLHHAQSKRKASVTALRPTTSRPVLPRATSSQQFVASMPPGASPLRLPSKAYRQLRFDDSGRLSKNDRNTPVLQLPSKAVIHPQVPSGAKSSKHINKQHGMKPSAKHYHDVTPPEEEPGMTRASVFHQGDSYFHTWNTETMHSKEFTPARTPAESETYTPRVGIELRDPVGNASRDLPKTATGLSTASNSKKRKSSALFSLFRKTAFNEEIDYSAFRKQGKPRRARPVPATRTGTPGITISSPADSHSVRNRSIVPELQAPSYFARPRIYRDDSDQSVARSPGHASTGYGTYEENVAEDVPTTPYSSRSRRRNRSSSEALSPMALPRRRPHLRHRGTLATSTDSFDTSRKASPGRLPLSAIGSEAGSGASNKWGIPPVDTARIRATTSTVIVGSAASDSKEMRSQALTFQEPVLRKKSSIWKGLMHGLRRVSSLGVTNQSFEEALPDHKRSGLKRISIPSLQLRASRSSVNVRNGKLARKVSRGSQVLKQVDSEDEVKVQADADEKIGEGRHSQSSPERPGPISITAEDLVVTEFEQTPFSKRYYDSIRSEQQAIRALIDETMEEDDEADDEVVLGFEQNVPDHLPNSPLCPLHPKHRSGGKAICHSHGRYKPKKAQPSPLHKVEIVFDTSEDVVQRSTQSDGTALLASKLETVSQSFFNVDRRRIQTSSMGSDGAESFMGGVGKEAQGIAVGLSSEASLQ
ncbi:hypothetical protein Slin14017_G035190 [Septoria linicola]|nr:hypothetical protein Slin14017_G035190 [Septoria linicola]